MPDHVYLFVSVPPSERSSAFAPAEIIRLFKGITSRKLKKGFSNAKHPHSLRRQYCGEHATLWAEGYYVGTASYVSADTIKRYIEEIQKK